MQGKTGQSCPCRQDKKKDELLSMDPEKITYEIVSDKQRAIAQARGKRGTDRYDQLEMLQFLAKVSKGPVQEIEVRSRHRAHVATPSPSSRSPPGCTWRRDTRPEHCLGRVAGEMLTRTFRTVRHASGKHCRDITDILYFTP